MSNACHMNKYNIYANNADSHNTLPVYNFKSYLLNDEDNYG